MAFRVGVFALLLLVCFLVSERVWADGGDGAEPASSLTEYSPYEQEAIDLVLVEYGFEVELDPEGKLIERVEIVTLPVSEARDPLPGFVNVFHVVSKRKTVERELLVRVGDRYRAVLVDETARNLRSLIQFSVVLCVPVRGTSDDRVGLVVITKDIWSLRLNSDVRYSRGGLESLTLQPAELNVFGTHHTGAVLFRLDPASWATGAQYIVPRVTGYLLRVSGSVNVIVNRDTGKTEGSWGGYSVGRPLLTSRTEWSWYSSTVWKHDVTRRFVDARLALYDAAVTDVDDGIPYEYRGREVLHRSAVTRSYGWAVKNDFSVGVEYDYRVYAGMWVDGVAEEALREFRDLRVPTDTTRLSPFLQFDGYSTDYMRVLDMETLGLQEDYQLGHSVAVKVYPAVSGFGSTRSLFGVFVGVHYTVPLGDGLARVGVENTTEVEWEKVADGAVRVNARVVSPRLGFGRVLVDTDVLYRYRNYMTSVTWLGGNTRLRGYPSNFFAGEDVVTSNLEYRSKPLDLLTLQLGGAVFYDTGVVWDRGGAFDVHSSVGFGVRALLPQIDRVVMRADVGFPLAEHGLPVGVSPYSFYLAVGQAFPMPVLLVP
ncbi:MAG: outer membrane protein assembly factor [Polyangiaceae bacterium]|nr:outer membrane protein assembly factor [Polyangiaceae bacterium]